MESYRLNSKIIEEGKEYFIQTTNDVKAGIIRTSLFQNGELLDTAVLPHSEDVGEAEVLSMVKAAHQDKKSELEYLLKSYKEIIKGGQPRQMYHLGAAMLYKKMVLEAQHLFRAAIKMQPDFHEAYFSLAHANLILGHNDDAVDAAMKAVDLKPEYADYRNTLGEAFLEMESCKRAVIEFEKAIEANVYYADAYFNLAMARILNAIRKEDYELSADLTSKCTDLLKKAVLIYPDYQTALYNQAISTLSSGDLKKAYTILNNVREEKKEKVRQEKAAHFQRYLIYTDWLSEEAIGDRIKLLEDQINKNPDYVDLYYDLAISHLHQACFSWNKGLENFKKALVINKNMEKARKALNLSEKYYMQLSEAITDITELDERAGR